MPPFLGERAARRDTGAEGKAAHAEWVRSDSVAAACDMMAGGDGRSGDGDTEAPTRSRSEVLDEDDATA